MVVRFPTGRLILRGIVSPRSVFDARERCFPHAIFMFWNDSLAITRLQAGDFFITSLLLGLSLDNPDLVFHWACHMIIQIGFFHWAWHMLIQIHFLLGWAHANPDPFFHWAWHMLIQIHWAWHMLIQIIFSLGLAHANPVPIFSLGLAHANPDPFFHWACHMLIQINFFTGLGTC